MNCRQRVDYADQHYHREDMPHVAAYFTCDKPAPPEPAAPVNGSTPVGEYDPDMKPAAREMPEAVRVGTFQLEELLKWADLAEVSLRTGFAPPTFLGMDLPHLLRISIAAVRQQAAQVKL